MKGKGPQGERNHLVLRWGWDGGGGGRQSERGRGGNYFRRKIGFGAVFATGCNSQMQWPAAQAPFQGQRLGLVICLEPDANEGGDKDFFFCELLTAERQRSWWAPVCRKIEADS